LNSFLTFGLYIEIPFYITIFYSVIPATERQAYEVSAYREGMRESKLFSFFAKSKALEKQFGFPHSSQRTCSALFARE
jgi:hypothetical protein